MDQDIDQILADAGVEAPQERILTDLAAYVRQCWGAASRAKSEIEDTLLRCLRQRNGVYDPTVLQTIREQGGSEVFMNLTQVKCRAAESWIHEILFPPGEVPFAIEPTPVPDLNGRVHDQVAQSVQREVQEALQLGVEVDPAKIEERITNIDEQVVEALKAYAHDRADGMMEHIKDITREGGWFEGVEEFISDFVTYPAAFLKGPVRVNKKCLNWGQDEFGQYHPEVYSEIKRIYKRVSPFDIFPSPDAKSTQDGYLIERARYRRKDLYELIGVPGYDEAALREVLHMYGDSGYKLEPTDTQDRLENRSNHEEEANIEAINFNGPVRGQWLLDWGLSADLVPDPDDDYESNIIVIGSEVIRAAINPHPLGRRPYHAASFEGLPGSIWRTGLVQILADLQGMCNSTARALINNMSLASSPMMYLQIDRLAEGEDPGNIHPFRVWQTVESKTGSSGAPIQFFQPDSLSGDLTGVFRFFSTLADEYSGIPPYAQGMNTSGGAAGTATGLAMLQDNAARGIKRAVKAIDTVIKSSVEATFEDVMMYDDVPKGDIRVVAKASSAMVNRERESYHLNELLMTTGNPMDQQIIGLEGRRKMLEDAIQARGIDPSEILPSKDEMASLMMQQQMMQQQMAQQQMAQQQMAQSPETLPAQEAGMPPVRPN